MKFKIGDIIIANGIMVGREAKVISVTDTQYILERQWGKHNSDEFPVAWVEECFILKTKLYEALK